MFLQESIDDVEDEDSDAAGQELGRLAQVADIEAKYLESAGLVWLLVVVQRPKGHIVTRYGIPDVDRVVDRTVVGHCRGFVRS